MKKLVTIVVLSIFSLSGAMAQLTKVDQEVFGMDCAPCAYGLERGLKKMDGLESVQVSLNDGKAYINLTSDNQLTLQKIQQEVKTNGFSARAAEVVLLGELRKKDEEWQVFFKEEIFTISPETSSEILKSLNIGKVKVKLLVEDKEDKALNGSWVAQIVEIH